MSKFLYLAAPYAEKVNMPIYAAQFEAAGYSITHKWWLVDEDGADFGQCAQADLEGVIDADYLVLFNSAISEGKSFEQGVAVMEGMMIIGIGKPGQHYPDGKSYGNVFHSLDNYIWVENVNEALDTLKELEG